MTAHVAAHTPMHKNRRIGALQRAWKCFTAHIMYRGTVNALSQLSDHQLRDLGIHRSSIDSVARDCAGYQHNSL